MLLVAVLLPVFLLLRLTAADTIPILGGNVWTHTFPSQTTQCGAYSYYIVNVADPCADLTLA